MRFISTIRLACVAMIVMLCAVARADNVEIRVERFGACNAFRGGDVTALRVRLRSDLAEPTTALVQWDVENIDGDVASYWREVILPPGQNVSRWLYAKLPPLNSNTLASQVFNVSVFQTENGRRVGRLGALRFTPLQAEEQSLPIEKNQDVIAIVGDGRMGLQDLGSIPAGFNFVPSMNSLTQLPRGISPADFPDRWEGLWSFNEVIWSQASPQLLTGDRAKALRDWIARGGSLVIVLPESGNSWSIGGGAPHFLSDLLPTQGVTQLDGVPVEALRPILSRATQLRRENVRTALYVFDPIQLSAPWKGLIALPKISGLKGVSDQIRERSGGTSIVVRRTFGHGMITLIGLDVDALHRGAYANDSLPQVDVFWNRILGRRADSMSVNDFDRLMKSEPPRIAIANSYDQYDCGGGDLISSVIGLQGRAIGGIFATLGLFVAYWVLACPVAWYVLRKKNQRRLSWLVFVGVSLVASMAAYVVGGFFSTTPYEIRHATVLDTIDQPAPSNADARFDRATMWISALLPGFGKSEIAVDNSQNQRNIISTWAPPTGDSGARFPDTTRFDQPVDEPDKSAPPSRATTSDFEIRWLGNIATQWGATPTQVQDKPIRATTTQGNTNRISLSGSLTHHLPGALKNVTLIHVSPFQFQTQQWQGEARLTLQPSDPLPNAGRMIVLAVDWMPDQELDVAKLLYPNGPSDPGKLNTGSLTQEIFALYQRPLLQKAQAIIPGQMKDVFEARRWQTNMEMLSLYQMLQPPAYQRNPPDAPNPVRVTREVGKNIDLSRWLTQPCLIVMGKLENVSTPVPFTLAGKIPNSTGDVLVRYIIPLPDDAAIFWPPLPVP